MKFTCGKTALQTAVSITSRASSPKSSMKALEGIFLQADMDKVRLTGYDLKKAIYTDIRQPIEQPGEIVLNAKMLGSIINTMPEGEVTIQTQNLMATIIGQNAQFTIQGSDPDDFPDLPDIESEAGISLPQNLLGKMISQTIFAVSDNEARPVYTGELFELENNTLLLSACDGYRLSLRREPVTGVEENRKFIVPATALRDLERLCRDTDDPIQINLGSKYIGFAVDNTVLISRRLEGDFIDYRTAVPNQFRVKVRADRSQLQRCVERVSLIIDDRMKTPVRITFQQNQALIESSTTVSRASDLCALDGDGENIEIGFNNRYILDALKNAPADELTISLNKSTSPCVITSGNTEDQSFLYMVLPVRLKAEE